MTCVQYKDDIYVKTTYYENGYLHSSPQVSEKLSRDLNTEEASEGYGCGKEET
jgi:hypothetical protein